MRIEQAREGQIAASRWTLPVALTSVFTAALAFRCWIWYSTDFTYDDTFIILRIARNYAQGLGLVFNAGDHLQSGTSLLYTLAAGHLWRVVEVHTLSLLRLLGAVADSVTAVLIVRLVQESVSSSQNQWRMMAGLVAGYGYALLSTSAVVAVSGMEAALYTLSIAAAFFHLANGRTRTATILASFSFFLRPDGILVLMIVSLFVALEDRERRTACLAIALAAVGGYLITVSILFDHVVPQTMTAKSLLARDPVAVWREFVFRFYLSPSTILLGGLSAIGLLSQIVQPRTRALVIWGLGYVASFCTFSTWWPWYLPPFAFWYFFLIGIGMLKMFEIMDQAIIRSCHDIPRASVDRAFVFACIVFIAAIAANSWSRIHNLDVDRLAAHREQARAVSSWLNRQLSPGATIMLEPMGEIGFLADVRIEDYPGLASRRVTDALRSLNRKVGGSPMDAEAFLAALARVMPDAIILRHKEFDVLRKTQVQQHYVERFQCCGNPASSEGDYVVMIRRDLLR